MIKEGKNWLSQPWILLFIWVLLIAGRQACDPGCGNCVIYSDYCQQCLGNYQATNGRLFIFWYVYTCVCPSGTYYNGSDTCPSCSFQCSTCVNTATYCLTCSSAIRQSVPSCSCPAIGYYESNTAACGQCHFSCYTCNGGNSNNCQSCLSSMHRSLNSGYCNCVARFYETNTALCGTCHFSCYTCSSTTVSTCQSCASSDHRSLSSGYCNCVARYYESNTAVCGTCHFSCYTCSSTSNNACQSCSSSDHRSLSSGYCNCMIGYYQASTTICGTCDHSCQECTNSSGCTSCDVTKKRVWSSNSAYCVCMERYYDSGAQLCSSCHPTCYQCSSSTASGCTACNPLSFRVKSGSSCLCLTGYYETSSVVQLCSPCLYSCQSCNFTSTNCLSCDATLNRGLTLGSCPCKAKYFQNSSKLCDGCHSSCATCTNSSACVTCISSEGTVINSSNLCSCALGKFFNGSTCLACDYRCLSCVDSATKCLSCPVGSNRVYASNTCSCIVNYYDSGAINCTPCHYSCYTCSGTTSSTCLSCNPSSLRNLQSNVCVCPDGYYDNSVSVCKLCSYTCLKCTNGSECSACDSNKMRSLSSSTKMCECLSNYFEYNKVCFACLSTCLTCTNNKTCDSCDSSLHLTLNSITLLCECIDGYYKNAANTCILCDSVCSTCQGTGVCLTCKSGLYRTFNSVSSTCDCQVGYVLNTTSNLCVTCHYSCQICVSGFNDQCFSCNSSYFRTLDSIGKKCPCNTGFYDDGANALCLPCSYTCVTCQKSANNCLSCKVGSFRIYDSAAHTCACQQHYFDSIVIFIQSADCAACPYHCSSCNNPSSCLTCNASNHRIFDSQRNKCICNIGYYDDNTNKELCATCSYQCQSCTNSSKCLTCDSSKYRADPATLCPCNKGFYDTGISASLCSACHYSCKTCTNGTKCASCEAFYNRVMNATSKMCICLGRFFDAGVQTCQSCDYSCLTCVSSALHCLTCNGSSLRTLNAVSNSCPCNDGYYDAAVQLCSSCQYSCKTCGNNKSCLSCNSSNFRFLNSESGLCDCMIGYYDTKNRTQLCKRCDLTCLSCSNGTHCESCDASRNRTLNATKDYANNTNQYCPCFYGYYSVASNDSCKACHFSCAVCNGPNSNNCLFCDSSSQRSLSGSSKCSCKKGYFDTNMTMSCPPCHVACASCWNNLTTTCFKCSASFFIAVGNNTCFQTCPTYYFDDTVSMICSSCSSHCTKCVNASYCTACESPTFLNISSCIINCPLGQYGNETTHSCQNCKEGCANCTASYNCFQCVNTSFYVDQATTLCFSCSVKCLTCFGPSLSQCLNCSYPLYLNSEHTCVTLSCPYGQYPDTFDGCVNCDRHFSHSLHCNLSQALLCKKSTILSQGLCVACDQVTGFALDSSGNCNQICGDGILIKYQCDDGNKRNGDGCSSSCVIQEGWSCSTVSGRSKCQISGFISMKLKQIHKYARKNKLLLTLTISMPIYLDNSNFAMRLIGLDSTQYSIQCLPQDEFLLTQISCILTYQVDIAHRDIEVSYNKNNRRLLQMNQHDSAAVMEVGSLRQLTSAAFQVTVTIESFPPANLIEEDTLSLHESVSNLIFYLSICFVVVNFIIVPKQYALHSISLSWIVPYLYLTFFQSTAYTNQWISSNLSKLRYLSLLGGSKLGQCCFNDTFQNISSQLFVNIGYIMIVLMICWAVFGIAILMRKCYRSQASGKFVILMRYSLLTVHLLVFLQIVSYSFYGLSRYQLSTITDVANITFSLFFSFSSIFLVIVLWYLTAVNSFESENEEVVSVIATKQTVQQREKSNKTEEKQYGQIINLSEIKEQTRINSTFGRTFALDTKRPFTAEHSEQNKGNQEQSMSQSQYEEIEQEWSMFPFDYSSIYKHKHPKAKYFLPLLMTKLLLMAIFNSALMNRALPLMLINAALSLFFLLFLLVVRPFQSTFSNVKVITLYSLLLFLNGTYLIYQAEAEKNVYIDQLQKVVSLGVVVLLLLGILFSLIEHYRIWIKNVWSLCDDCVMGLRLQGASNQVFDVSESKKVEIKVEEVQKEEFMEDQAFYVRMLRKQTLNKQYKRERMIRDSSHFLGTE